MSAHDLPTNPHEQDPSPSDPSAAHHTAHNTDTATPASASVLTQRPMVIALVLSILTVIGVLVVAKITYQRAAHQPVAMAQVNAPEAESADCANLLEQLPGKLGGRPRAEIADPAPAGAAAWASNSTDQVSLRCGVGLPAQFTELSQTVAVDGVQWLPVRDDTPGSDLATWYSVSTAPVVALTDAGDVAATTPSGDLAAAVAALPENTPEPSPTPLAGLAQDGPQVGCAEFVQALPASIGDFARVDEQQLPASARGSVVYAAQGFEPIVVRCGVGFPDEYQAGEHLDEVNGVAWLTSTTLANGTTAGTYFGLGREATVAVSTPRAAGGSAMTAVSTAMVKNIPEAAVAPTQR